MSKYIEDLFWTRKVQTIPKNRTAMISIAAPIVRALKLNTHDVLYEQLDPEGRIILTKRQERLSDEDGVV